ncbi:DoxX family protein [Rhodococcus sp. HNM0569]|nr:DoxX family protein [Rhodococcus sp. HNM0569]NLU81594.1 DoxX family protein [Rhodococcus sp. HNM0569]
MRNDPTSRLSTGRGTSGADAGTSAGDLGRPSLSPFDDLPTESFPAGRSGAPAEPSTSDAAATEILPTSGASTAGPAAPTPAAGTPSHRERDTKTGRGTLDLGLLALRLVVGGTLLVHGLQKLTGLWNGPGLDGFETLLAEGGFDQARALAVAGAVGETAAGVLLVLGLLTPVAAAGALALMINAWAFRQAAEPGLAYFAPDGVEYETLLGVCAGVLILTGPGRIALDGRRGWATRPFAGSLVLAVVGIAGGVALWIFLNGANPLV